MKKQNLLFLLSAVLIASCNSNTPSNSTTPSSNESSSDVESIETSELSSSDEVLSESTDLFSNSEELSESSSNGEPSISDSSETIDKIEVSTPLYKEKNVTHYLGSDNDVYRINITTNDGVFPLDKETYIHGSLNVTEQNFENILHDSMQMKIKLRGNSTMGADKKPFKIKFEEKQSMFGLTKAKEWVLLANYYDKSNIRNYLAYLTANKLTNLDFQPSSIFVDVYFNNEYLGLYLFCEQMEANPGRVDIKNNVSEDGINSFFIEADERAKDEYPGMAGSCYIQAGGYDFALKEPDCDDLIEALELINSSNSVEAAEAQQTLDQFAKDTAWLQQFLNQTADSIFTLTNYTNYIDVESFIDYYLVQEFFKNVDVGSTSQFYFIDQQKQKLTAGPVWDFDIGLGAVDDSISDIYSFYANETYFVKERDYFYKALFQDQSFYELAQERYSEVRNTVFLSVFDEMELACNILEKAQERNLKKWPFTHERKTWVEIYALATKYYNIRSLDAHYDYIEVFLTERLAALDSLFNYE